MVPITIILLTDMIYGSGSDSLLWAAVALVIVSIVLTLAAVAIAFYTTPKFMNFENTVKRRLQAYLDSQNKQLQVYHKEKYQWRMQERFFWLELEYHSSPADKERPRGQSYKSSNPSLTSLKEVGDIQIEMSGKVKTK